MSPGDRHDNTSWIATHDEGILVTGAAGFVGSRVVQSLLNKGFHNIRCLVRPSSDLGLLHDASKLCPENHLNIMEGTLLSKDDCSKATQDVSIVYHLVAGRGKSFPTCFQNSVVSTRNLLDACLTNKSLKRFVNVSSIAVYSNLRLRRGAVLDESCPLEDNLAQRHDAYVYGKLKQDDIVLKYHQQHGLPYVIVRPGIVFGSGKRAIPGTVGIDTFGIFMHLGGKQPIPLTYVDNCADAIVLAGLVPAIEKEVFNVVDDDLPASRSFLRRYKQRVGHFPTIPIPYWLFYLFSFAWEKYAAWSRGQIPPVFNRRSCAFSWKGHRYSNKKLKERLGWAPVIPMKDALERYFEYQRKVGGAE